jgi:hypothetical protein
MPFPGSMSGSFSAPSTRAVGASSGVVLDFNNVVLQLEFEGTDGDTTTTDVSNSAHTITLGSGTVIDDAQAAVGSTSLWMSTKSTATGDIGDWQFGATEDFTMEMYIRFNADPGTADKPFLATYHVPNNACIMWWLTNNEMQLVLGNGSAEIARAVAAWNPAGGTWYHIAVCRASGTTEFFVDGTSIGTSAALDGVTNVNGTTYFGLSIGAYWNGAVITSSAWFDSIRIVAGQAMYTADFTPPTVAHPTS